MVACCCITVGTGQCCCSATSSCTTLLLLLLLLLLRCCIYAMPLHSAAAVPFLLSPLLLAQRSRWHCSWCLVSAPRPSA